MEKPEEEVSPISNIVDLEDGDDNHHLSSFITPIISSSGSSKINAISVEQYTHVRELQFAIMASLLGTTTPPPPVINLDDYDDDDDVKVLNFKPSPQPPQSFGSRRKRKRTLHISSVTETGQSSNSKTDAPFMCEICVEPKPMNESFSIQGCTHSYCTGCMTKYVASKLQENVTSILCPELNCPGVLEPEYCRGILPPEVFDRWGNALCESVLLASEKFYCPYKDCSALMIHDEGGLEINIITQSECPYCKRLFCVQCKAAWHPGINCEEFQEMNKDEREKEAIMLKELAKKKKWKRCPECRFYVARNKGCNHMRCRCGCFFCYSCGDPLTGQNLLCGCTGKGTPLMGGTPPFQMGLRPSLMGWPLPQMGLTQSPMGGTPPLPMGFTPSPMNGTPPHPMGWWTSSPMGWPTIQRHP